MSLAHWWDDDEDLQQGRCVKAEIHSRASSQDKNARRHSSRVAEEEEEEEEVCKEHGLRTGACQQCALIAASSAGPWWADGWARHKEVFDQGVPGSLPLCSGVCM